MQSRLFCFLFGGCSNRVNDVPNGYGLCKVVVVHRDGSSIDDEGETGHQIVHLTIWDHSFVRFHVFDSRPFTTLVTRFLINIGIILGGNLLDVIFVGSKASYGTQLNCTGFNC